MEKASHSEFPLVLRGSLDDESPHLPLMCNTAHRYRIRHQRPCVPTSQSPSLRLEVVGMPPRIHPLSITPHKNLRGSSRTHPSLTIFLRLHQIRSPDNRHVPKPLYLRPREFQSDQFSAIRLKLRRCPHYVRLV